MPTILIGGDVNPGGRSLPHFMKGDARSIFNDLLANFRDADLSIVNLECPLIMRASPIDNHTNDLTVPLTFLKDNSGSIPQQVYE